MAEQIYLMEVADEVKYYDYTMRPDREWVACYDVDGNGIIHWLGLAAIQALAFIRSNYSFELLPEALRKV